MSKILRVKILKGLPVWMIIIILLTAGIGLAAFTFLSNQITTQVTITEVSASMSIAGSFTTTGHPNEAVHSYFTYTVNSGTPIGYVLLTYVGPCTSSSDISGGSTVYPTLGTYHDGFLVTGYPKYTSLGGGIGQIDILFQDGYTPFNFGSTTGNIDVTTYYAVAGTWTCTISVTSNTS
jgi:hypothetical protein